MADSRNFQTVTIADNRWLINGSDAGPSIINGCPDLGGSEPPAQTDPAPTEAQAKWRIGCDDTTGRVTWMSFYFEGKGWVTHTPGSGNGGGSENRPPTIQDIANRTILLGNPVDIAISVSDPDGDSVSCTVTGLPAGLSFNGSAIVGTPTAEGTFSILASCTDPSGATDVESFTWTIEKPCEPSDYLDANGRWGWGINLAWRLYGIDFPTREDNNSHWFMTEQTAIDVFADVAAQNVQYVRWWLWCDGRGGPEFNPDGSVSGLDPTTALEVGRVLDAAQAAGITLVLTLWNHDMFSDGVGSDYDNSGTPDCTINYHGPHAGNHIDLVTDLSKTQSYINNALIPLLNATTPNGVRIGDHPNLHIDVFNEPELGMSDVPQRRATCTAYPGAPRDAVRRFIAMTAGTIRRNGSVPITVGNHEIRYLVDPSVVPNALGNWWSDAEMQQFDPDASFDYYSPHWYLEFQGETFMDPTDWPASIFDKPVIIGETAGNTLTYDRAQQWACLGYAGAWPWTYFGTTDSYGNWSDAQSVIDEFYQNQP